MNSTLSITFNNTVASWIIPFDILMIVCTIFVIIIGTIYLVIIIIDKTCHTVPMLLLANSCLAEVLFASVLLGMAIFATENDFKHIQYHDSSCIIRGYLEYVGYALQNYSYLLQAFYRYVTVVYPTRLSFQSVRIQVLFICITWILAFIYPLPYIIKNEIQYNPNNHICTMPLQFAFLTIYNAIYVFGIPMNIIILIYYKLVRYVKVMGQRIIAGNTLIRARQELKMVRRIVILVTMLLISGIPYTLFIFMAFFNSVPIYHFRISFIFVDVVLVAIMIALFRCTDQLKKSIMKRIKRRPNAIVAAVI